MSNADIVALCAGGGLFCGLMVVAVLWDSTTNQLRERGWYKRGQGRD